MWFFWQSYHALFLLLYENMKNRIFFLSFLLFLICAGAGIALARTTLRESATEYVSVVAGQICTFTGSGVVRGYTGYDISVSARVDVVGHGADFAHALGAWEVTAGAEVNVMFVEDEYVVIDYSADGYGDEMEIDLEYECTEPPDLPTPVPTAPPVLCEEKEPCRLRAYNFVGDDRAA